MAVIQYNVIMLLVVNLLMTMMKSGGCLFPAGADLLLCIEYAFVAFDSFYNKENDAYVLLVGTKFRKGAGSYAKQLDR